VTSKEHHKKFKRFTTYLRGHATDYKHRSQRRSIGHTLDILLQETLVHLPVLQKAIRHKEFDFPKSIIRMVVGPEANRFKARLMKIHNYTVKATAYTSSFVESPFDIGHMSQFNDWLSKMTTDLGFKPTKAETDEIVRLTTKVDPDRAANNRLYLQQLRDDTLRVGKYSNYEEVSKSRFNERLKLTTNS